MNSIKVQKKFDESLLEKGSMYSFLNFASLSFVFDRISHEGITYFCDGFLMSSLVQKLTGEKVERISFDFTSIAGPVFEMICKNKLRLAVIGAQQDELEAFVKKIKSRYPSILVVSAFNGYFSEDEQGSINKSIINSDIDVAIVGLGAGKQEDFMLSLRKSGYCGTLFSCGGFIRQEARSHLNYYPLWVNRFNLRAFYRMLKEPHTIKRYLIQYPMNSFLLVKKFLLKKIDISIVK